MYTKEEKNLLVVLKKLKKDEIITKICNSIDQNPQTNTNSIKLYLSDRKLDNKESSKDKTLKKKYKKQKTSTKQNKKALDKSVNVLSIQILEESFAEKVQKCFYGK